MGKASRRRHDATASKAPRTAPVPYVARPFAGLDNEPGWVALREMIPAATATVRLRGDAPGAEGLPDEVTVATVLPLAWPGLHRGDGTVLVGTQAGASSGDPSRDLAAQILAARALEAGTPLLQTPAVTAESPRLQDILDPDAPMRVEVHSTFDFWVSEADLDEEAASSLERANESIVPTVELEALPSTYWVQIGDRAYVRHILGDDEDAATDALARLHAAGDSALGEGTRLLGAFRACGLLVPVWEVELDEPASAHEPALTAWGERYAAALASDAPLTAEERRARNGLLSRQVTLR